jgi:phosphoserine phosphatase RsbU/P
MLRHRSIATRLLLLVLVGTGALMGTNIVRNYTVARHLLEDQAREKTMNLAVAAANHIEAVIGRVEKVGLGLAREVEDHPPQTQAQAMALLSRVVAANPEVYGSALALARDSRLTPVRLPTSYAYRRHGLVVSRLLERPGYDWDRQGWYTEPCARRRPVWSDPYFDRGGGDALMVTYSAPLFDPAHGNPVCGVVTCDVALPWLGKAVRALSLGKTGYGFVISHDGTYIVHPNPDYVLRKTVFQAAREAGSEDLVALARRMVAGEQGFAPLISQVTGRPSRLAFAPIPSAGWCLAVVISQDELLAPIVQLRRQESAASAIAFVLLSLIALLIARSITGPLRQLEAATHTLAAGNLHAPLPEIAGADEVARLGQSFSAMRESLLTYVENLRETTAAKERLTGELEVARSIQMSLVPPGLPEASHEAYELVATLDAAREVGGDLYDYMLLDDHILGVVVGDVSGKGVPAAIFMAATTALLRALWRQHVSPAQALEHLNAELSREDHSSMFVTLLCLTLDLRDGTCRYASAGHLPALLKGAQGTVTPLPRVRGAAAGVVADAVYEEGTLRLGPGDTLFLYTDGVTETMTAEGELFGLSRTLTVLTEQEPGTPPGDLLANVRTALKLFAGEADQSDDIAMLALRFRRRGSAF